MCSTNICMFFPSVNIQRVQQSKESKGKIYEKEMRENLAT